MTNEIAQRLETIYQGEPWFGESLVTKLNGMTDETAFRQPVGGKHSIAEIVSHMEFWRRSFVHQLKGDASIDFSTQHHENWPLQTSLQKKGWKNIIVSFEATHTELIKLLKKSEGNTLDKDVISNLKGLIDHDIYHLGQIGYIKSLLIR